MHAYANYCVSLSLSLSGQTDSTLNALYKIMPWRGDIHAHSFLFVLTRFLLALHLLSSACLPAFCLSICLSVGLPDSVSDSLSVHLSVCLPVCPSLSLSLSIRSHLAQGALRPLSARGAHGLPCTLGSAQQDIGTLGLYMY